MTSQLRVEYHPEWKILYRPESAERNGAQTDDESECTRVKSESRIEEGYG
jgi:hypothetical protein